MTLTNADLFWLLLLGMLTATLLIIREYWWKPYQYRRRFNRELEKVNIMTSRGWVRVKGKRYQKRPDGLYERRGRVYRDSKS